MRLHMSAPSSSSEVPVHMIFKNKLSIELKSKELRNTVMNVDDDIT